MTVTPRWALRFPARQDTFADRMERLRRRWRLFLRLSLATSVAYAIATHGLGHQQAFFAPIAAIIVIVAGAGVRMRALIELIVGVATGVLVGEGLIHVIGRGSWQLALVVALAVAVATLLGLKGIALTQAASSSVLLATVIPVAGSGNPAATRFVDALVGGLCGLLLVILLPRNPVRDIDREVQTLLTKLAAILVRVATALRTNDDVLADKALDESRRLQPLIDQLQSTAANVSEIARMSPVRWRQRSRVELYASAVVDLDNAARDTRVLARKASALLRHHEPVHADLALAIDALASAFEIFADDLAEQDDFDQARLELVQAARMAQLALPEVATMNSAAIAAQIRSLAADLLYATGYTRDEIDERLDFD